MNKTKIKSICIIAALVICVGVTACSNSERKTSDTSGAGYSEEV